MGNERCWPGRVEWGECTRVTLVPRDFWLSMPDAYVAGKPNSFWIVEGRAMGALHTRFWILTLRLVAPCPTPQARP